MQLVVILVCLLEALGLAAVPWQLWRAPVRTWLRVAKPIALLLIATVLSQVVGDSIATFCLILNTTYSISLHRAHCGPGWLRATSPYLYRNPKQQKMWAALC